MCGIAGTYRWPDGKAVTDRLTGVLAHRGPDGSGHYGHPAGDGEVHLGHRRLAIIDLSETGAQPMAKDGLVLTYNGELYNAPELRAELEAAGARFRGTSDTEVLLESWRRWGTDCLPRLRGMFAFGVFDERTGELVLARDQLGIKPLFLIRRGEGLVFASELKALAAVTGGSLEVDHAALVASLLYYWVPDSRCAFREAEKLPPGSWLRIRPDGRVERGRYWNLRDVAAEARHQKEPDIAAVVEESTRRHLLSDVPVATFLSGGLDSSYLTALAARDRPGISAYTIGFRAEDSKFEAMPDDLRYARQVAERFGVDLHEIEIAPDVLDLLPRMTYHLDEPIGDPAAINTFLICTAAREAGVKVMLSGMGADELFAGYRKHLANLLALRYQRVPRPLRRGLSGVVDRLPVASARRGYRSVRFAKRFLSFADLPEETAFRRSYTLYDRAELLGLIDPDLAGTVDDVLTEHADTYEDNDLDDFVNRMCLGDARMFLPGLNLAYTDRSSMAASTEVRVPYVDVEVVKAAFAVPGDRKIAGRQGKAVLKEAALSVLPREIVYRPKGLFSAPLRAWMSRDLAPLVQEVVHDGVLVRSGFLRREALARMVAEDAAGQRDFSKHLWHVLTLEYWYRGATSGSAPLTA
ncbi:asparagine synthase (glutamine-hydrolyzing) [Streptomyces acidiscabies]|uniref:asparagine synthase (glutamine-hydrolyzing) n=1 Tax=Streptomyces acidiscabies TaxID=42234 RepID=A0AAP6BHA6_9ACTN|nr:asparagine synthase (glutamine-hydrolyzing) [Streptomyces acidiscabies]MBZ3918053.1 asparagine synthase (glutamine-hydrolyzing) [Streptomyces acidiscabies]MDX2964703.1 asparagine synthase (glutamine-hydrolyzing) [Streptomyces acidiscabies]MDX3021911.1 asparagine synthase (glutamine-hydrolyzing) [Streptomyces acidiscabies]MDX3789568.1 asparagine synthase (glutamine-hydrolyzing) [Streptomyces acidiscabies]GAV37456.1 asparagine synthetase [glutamine-hydrolyzing] 1 [Streptomyces acidiscabies]